MTFVSPALKIQFTKYYRSFSKRSPTPRAIPQWKTSKEYCPIRDFIFFFESESLQVLSAPCLWLRVLHFSLLLPHKNLRMTKKIIFHKMHCWCFILKIISFFSYIRVSDLDLHVPQFIVSVWTNINFFDVVAGAIRKIFLIL